MKKVLIKYFLCVTVLLMNIHDFLHAQPAEMQNSAQLELSLSKLNVLGSVLYIGAHPDDENTGLLAYLAKGRQYRTAYLSLTRGDGGQNLIGSEKGSEIGIIRTQELLQARKIDGAEQFFSRAVDFGFSKSAEESFRIWGKSEVLSDVVWVIRNFRPDIIITRFPPGGNGGHGHHTASAELAKEAFSAAADPNMFPEQLKYVSVWQTKRLFWNIFRPTENDTKGALTLDVGQYNSLLGKSYTEIAAESRSMHKSQGFGVSANRGSYPEYFKFVIGEPAVNDIMEGIDVSWNRIKNGKIAGKLIDTAINEFNPHEPQASLDVLVRLYAELNMLEDKYWADVKTRELLPIIQSCAGLWMEAIASDYSAAPGDELNIKTSIIKRTPNKFRLEKIEFPSISVNPVLNQLLELNKPVQSESRIKIPEDYPISQPYWLTERTTNGLFLVKNQILIGKAENPPSIPVRVYLGYDKDTCVFTLPLLYRWNDRVEGEMYRPFEVRPAVTANARSKVELFPDNQSRVIKVTLKSGSNNVNGEVRLKNGNGDWKIEPPSIPFSLKNRYDELAVSFKVTPPQNAETARFSVEVTATNKKYNKALVEIIHSHIKPQVYFPESEIKMLRLDVKKFASRIGYIMGSGDEIPDCLRSLGYNVVMLNDEQLEEGNLSGFDAIIAGIRAYNTRERIKYYQSRLMDYVKNGGTFIVQYNVSIGLQIPQVGPYPFEISTDRITVEDSPVKFVNPSIQLLNFPNKITQKDFEGWIQERGLYFADKWNREYETILAGHDPGERDLSGGMLFARYGKGIYIYTAYSWFRQLPDGVPGAYRIFVNLLSAGKLNGRANYSGKTEN